MKASRLSNRIYVCHTFYHVYITILKEFALGINNDDKATILLSTMSINYHSMPSRLRDSGLFKEVIMFDEKHRSFFPELDFFNYDQGNIVKNMFARIQFTKLLAKLTTPYIPVDFKNYDEIYVYCDSDPIGFYLNKNKIHYHAIEDGLNCLKDIDTARYDNKGAFKIKKLMSSLNLIFIQNGYGKYCIDMEVNDISVLKYTHKKYIEAPRKDLVNRLTAEEKVILMSIFIEDINALKNSVLNINNSNESVIILTEPLCDLDTRKTIFTDIINEYCEGKIAIIKQHPRDELNYKEIFPDLILLDKTIPMELLNFFGENRFDLVVSVLTQIDSITFAKEKIMLGMNFLDKYEDLDKHNFTI